MEDPCRAACNEGRKFLYGEHSPPRQNASKQMGGSGLGPTWRVEGEVLSDVDDCRAGGAEYLEMLFPADAPAEWLPTENARVLLTKCRREFRWKASLQRSPGRPDSGWLSASSLGRCFDLGLSHRLTDMISAMSKVIMLPFTEKGLWIVSSGKIKATTMHIVPEKIPGHPFLKKIHVQVFSKHRFHLSRSLLHLYWTSTSGSQGTVLISRSNCIAQLLRASVSQALTKTKATRNWKCIRLLYSGRAHALFPIGSSVSAFVMAR